MRSSLKYYNYSSEAYDQASISHERVRENHLKVIEGSYKPEFKIYSTSLDTRLLSKVQSLTKAVFNLSVIGLVGAALSYFCLLSLEFEVSKNLTKFENQIKNREDLRSYLGRAYSWASINEAAKENNLSEAKNIEFAKAKKTSFHEIYELDV